jgi:acetylornithine deacetylase
MKTLDILETLIAFPTVSRDPNRALIDWVVGLLAAKGIESVLVPDATGHKANLYATVGPRDRGGVMLSGHTDVVPVDGQAWTKPPFELTREGGRLYGRGTADMKGFCAAAIRAMLDASDRALATPLHLALSYDEEIGCMGVRSLIDLLDAAPVRPAICIVGEPTGMAIASGHKGKTALTATCHGEEGHSALAPLAMNALHLAADFTNAVRAKQAEIVADGRRDGDYDVPYTTLNVGRIRGGDALNIVPNRATVEFEIRNLAEDSPAEIIADLRARADAIATAATHPAARIEIAEDWSYPGLATPLQSDAIRLIRDLTGANGQIKVAFGTEGGLFDARLGIATAICGPGSMLQGHKPDEYVTEAQLAQCDTMLARLVGRLETGV